MLMVAIGAAVFIFFGGRDEPAKPVNAWAVNAPDQVVQSTSSKKDSLTSKAFGVVAGAAKKYANVDIGGVNPAKLQEQTVGSFQSAEGGMKKANN
ncbi:MAG: hypothetical protein ABIU18_06470 [Novosphingobium sp.]